MLRSGVVPRQMSREGYVDEALDPFRITDKLEDPLLEVMVSRLEVRGKHWFFQKVLRDYLDAMDIDSAETVLDMGCGTGVAARTIARRAFFSGRVTGIDLSPYLVEAARRLADDEGLGGRVEFHSGDTRDLDIPGSRFDAVVAHTLVSHVPEALTVLKEAGRIVKPGGLIAVLAGDDQDVSLHNGRGGKGRFLAFRYRCVRETRAEVGDDDRGRSHQLGQCAAQSLRQRCVFRREQLLHLYCTTTQVALSDKR